MRPRRFPILVALLLLVAQQVALAHAISHAGGETLNEQSLPHSKVCCECICYASSGAAAPVKAIIFQAAASFADARAVDAGHFHPPFFLRAFASRAPPTLL